MKTRRKTRAGRLARLDRFVLQREGGRLAGSAGRVVDLGIGGGPWTTLELARAVERLGLSVVGVDHDPEVVATALPHATPGVSFVEGSFDLPEQARPALLIRAMNVLRDYRPEDVPSAHQRLGEALVDGGLLIEGSCGAAGEILCAWLVRKAGRSLVREGLLFSTDFSRGFGPLQFRDRLPRDLRGNSGPGTPIGQLLSAWTAAVDTSGARTAHQRFVAGAAGLAAARDDVELAPDLWEAGFLVWRPPEARRPSGQGVPDDHGRGISNPAMSKTSARIAEPGSAGSPLAEGLRRSLGPDHHPDLLGAARGGRSLARSSPWAQAVLLTLELASYRALPEHDPGWIARRLGLGETGVAEALALLERTGQVSFDGVRYAPLEIRAVDVRSPESGRSLKQFWSEVSLDRLRNGADGTFSYNVFTVSEADLAKIEEMQRAHYRAIRALVAESSPAERVVLINLQLVPLDTRS